MSSTRPFIAARVELWLDRRADRMFRLLGWRERAMSYTGYGSTTSVRILGRVLLAPRWSESQLGKAAEEFLRRRGWRNFITAATVHTRYTIQLGGVRATGTTDRGGYIDHRIRDHGLAPGWHTATISLADGSEYPAEVLVIPLHETFGIVSDLDDTVLTTWLPRPLIAAWNSFFRTEAARQAVPGMAVLYRAFLDAHPQAPLVYLSTGAWNTQGFLRRFLTRHRFPAGPMLLTDWGPTNTGWFRSGMAHKQASLRQLAVEFPHIKWVLVGDDGQHDPEIYGEFATTQPEHVRAVLIRTLTAQEQFLAHGTLEPLEPAQRASASGVLTLSGPDGRTLPREARRAGILS